MFYRPTRSTFDKKIRILRPVTWNTLTLIPRRKLLTRPALYWFSPRSRTKNDTHVQRTYRGTCRRSPRVLRIPDSFRNRQVSRISGSYISKKEISRSMIDKIHKVPSTRGRLMSWHGNIGLSVVSVIRLFIHTDRRLFFNKSFCPPSGLNQTPDITPSPLQMKGSLFLTNSVELFRGPRRKLPPLFHEILSCRTETVTYNFSSPRSLT